MQPDVNCSCGHIRFCLSDGPERVKKMLSGKCTRSVFEKCFLAYVPKGYKIHRTLQGTKWEMQILGMIFQTRSSHFLCLYT